MAKNYVVNSRGEREPFSVTKVYNSALRVGASRSLAKDIAQKTQSQVYDGIKTSAIFSQVKAQLNKGFPQAALKFNLKKAMVKLGPTGFPFEKYMAEVLRCNGFVVKINQYVKGLCCSSYEIDFLANKKNLLYVGECKFRNIAQGKVHMETALANYARFLDIKNGGALKETEIKSLIVTNAKFTSQAIRYCHCCGVNLLGWKYPKNGSLERLIDGQKLYPLTILPAFSSRFYNAFLPQGIVLVKSLLNTSTESLAKKVGLSQQELAPLIKEAQTLLGV